jgi:putative transposase
MPGEVSLVIGQRIFIEECEHEFKRLISPTGTTTDTRRDLQFEEMRTGHRFTLSHVEFDRLILDKKIRSPSSLDHPGDEVPEEKCKDGELRDLRQNLLRAFDEAPVSKTDKALSKFVREAMERLKIESEWIPSGAALRTWLRMRGEPGKRRRKHMGRRREPGTRRKCLDPLVETIIKQRSELYFSKLGISKKDVYAAVRTDMISLNYEREENGLNPIRPPSNTTVWRRVTEDTRYDNARSRFGNKKANQMFKPLQTYEKPKRILEVVIIDDTVIDCHVIDEDFPVTVGRPHLSIAFDSFSRCVVGCVIGFSDPSVETAMATLRDVVRPKTDLKSKFPNLRGELMGGVPETVMFDRAWGFVGSSMIDALDDAGISLVSAPAGTPEYKGRGEHFFDTLNKRLFHKLPGAVPFKPTEIKAHELNPAAEARLTLAQVQELTLQAIIDYNNDFHTGLKDVPARLWSEHSRQGIQYPLNLLDIDMACAKLAGPRILSRKGIELNGISYCSPIIFDLLNDLLPTAPKRGHRCGTVEVKVKYLPEDLSKVFVWSPVGEKYVEVACLERRYTAGLSEFHHNKIEAFRKERGLAWTSEDERCTARTLLNAEATSQLSSRLIGHRRSAQKFVDRNRVMSPSITTESRSSQNRDAQIIPVESVSNRVGGDRPERASVRKHRPRKSTRDQRPGVQPVAATLLAGTISTAHREIPDPFASFDRLAMLASLENQEQP